MKTHSSIKPQEITRKWYVVDAKGKILGRVATQIAHILRGKHVAYFSSQWDMGDNVVVVNAEQIELTGKKETQKNYYHHTGYPGGLRKKNVATVRNTKPTMLLERAIQGMLPKTKLGAEMMKKLHIYTGSEHPHVAQKPEELKI